MNLKHRVALVTGGAGHIGSVLGESLAELGVSLVLLDIDEKQCHLKAKKIHENYNVETLALTVDLSCENDIKKIPERILKHFGSLNIIINCAALVGTSKLNGWAVPFEQQESETWRKALEINLTASFILVQSCQKILVQSGYGSIVNIGSTYGVVGPDLRLYAKTSLGNPAAYAASKGGLLQLTRWMATVLAPHVRVNSITPGGIFREHEEPFLSRYVERTPLKRMATEEDLKGAVAYLASDLSAYVTGHNLIVDGGWTAW